MNRRSVLATIGSTAAIATLAGCAGSSDDGDEYQSANGDDENGSGNGDETSDENSDENSTDEEELDPEEVENRDAGEDVLEFGDLQIVEYDYEIDERDYGDDRMVFEGIVENTDDEKYDSVTVSIRVYDEDGNQLDNYMDITSDLQAGGTWKWEVTPMEAADEIDDHDIAVTGNQYDW